MNVLQKVVKKAKDGEAKATRARAHLALSRTRRLLNLLSFCSAVSFVRCSLSRSRLRFSLSSFALPELRGGLIAIGTSMLDGHSKISS